MARTKKQEQQIVSLVGAAHKMKKRKRVVTKPYNVPGKEDVHCLFYPSTMILLNEIKKKSQIKMLRQNNIIESAIHFLASLKEDKLKTTLERYSKENLKKL